MSANIGDAVLPGDVIILDRNAPKLVIGPGLREDRNLIYAEIAGNLRCRDDVIYWIEGAQKRYVAARGDAVLGIVVYKMMDFYRVDIGSSEQALLSYLSFDGATKTNRPDIKIGDVLYGRLVTAGRNFEPEMVCIDSKGRSGGFGVLSPDRSQLIRTSTSFTRKLLSTKSNHLQQLSKLVPYEIAIGCNGRIWVKSRSIQETQIIVEAIESMEISQDDKYIKKLIRIMNQKLLGF